MKFNQFDIESAISDIIPHGLRKQIAATTQLYPSMLYGMLNADDERKSFQFGTLQIQSALDQIDINIGDRHWTQLEWFREMGKPLICQGKSVSVETGKLAKEVADVIHTYCTGKNLADQLKEIIEAERQIETTKKAVLEAIEKEQIRRDIDIPISNAMLFGHKH
jgi:hypothetical protein